MKEEIKKVKHELFAKGQKPEMTTFNNAIVSKSHNRRIEIMKTKHNENTIRISYTKLMVIKNEEELRFCIKRDLNDGGTYTFAFRRHSKYAIATTTIYLGVDAAFLTVDMLDLFLDTFYDL